MPPHTTPSARRWCASDRWTRERRCSRSSAVCRPRARPRAITEWELRLIKQAAQARIDAGDSAGAIALLQQIVARRPDLVANHVNLGIVLQDQGDYADAIAVYHRALALDPDANVHGRLAAAYTGDWADTGKRIRAAPRDQAQANRIRARARPVEAALTRRPRRWRLAATAFVPVSWRAGSSLDGSCRALSGYCRGCTRDVCPHQRRQRRPSPARDHERRRTLLRLRQRRLDRHVSRRRRLACRCGAPPAAPGTGSIETVATARSKT